MLYCYLVDYFVVKAEMKVMFNFLVVPEMNMFRRLVIVCIIAFAMRAKYYYIWLMGEH